MGLGHLRPAGYAPSALLRELRIVQLDPLSPCGNNADFVAMSRIEGLERGAFYEGAYASGFEHFSKERCLLPAGAFPYFAAQAPRRRSFRMGSRLERLPPRALETAFDFIAEHGPTTIASLDLGAVESIDWSGWKGTSRAARMAVEALVLQTRVVVCGRQGREKRYDLPERHLGKHGRSNGCSEAAFDEWSILERVRAAGLLSEGAGIWWASITRRTALERLLRDERLVRVQVDGIRAPLLALPRVARALDAHDLPMRLVGPLDAVLWNRRLVRELFGFEYLWEVYKPAHQRRHGWYVNPLLDGDRSVGRLEARLEGETLHVENVWEEKPGSISKPRLDELLTHHAWACGASQMVRPRSFDGRA